MKFKPEMLFSFVVILFFAYLVWEAKDWRPQARLYPWVVGVPMLLLAVGNLVTELRGGAKEKSSEATPVDFEFSKGIDPVLVRQRTINIFSWIFGFYVGVWLVGFSITIPLMVLLYLKVQTHEGWVISLVLTSAAWLVFWGLFERTLHLPLPEGQIILWLGL
tara:strand:- start:170 stop:655 length:486 start_codon:yes stop_codon:yes gene_type:complete